MPEDPVRIILADSDPDPLWRKLSERTGIGQTCNYSVCGLHERTCKGSWPVL